MSKHQVSQRGLAVACPEGKVGDLMFHVLSNLMRKDSLGVKVIWKAVI